MKKLFFAIVILSVILVATAFSRISESDVTVDEFTTWGKINSEYRYGGRIVTYINPDMSANIRAVLALYHPRRPFISFTYIKNNELYCIIYKAPDLYSRHNPPKEYQDSVKKYLTEVIGFKSM